MVVFSRLDLPFVIDNSISALHTQILFAMKGRHPNFYQPLSHFEKIYLPGAEGQHLKVSRAHQNQALIVVQHQTIIKDT